MVRQSNFTKKILFLKTKISEMLHDFMLKSMLIDKKSAFSGIGKMKTRICLCEAHRFYCKFVATIYSKLFIETV